jgi:riboflavin biosynthesis pyrimidine reductase
MPFQAFYKRQRKVDEISKLKVIVKDEERVEQKLNKLAQDLKIPFSVVVDKNARSKKEGPLGSTNLETRTIYVHRYKNYNDALRTFLHEFVEVILNPAHKALFTLLNAQNELLSEAFKKESERKIIDTYQQTYVNQLFYALQENVVEELVDLITRFSNFKEE